MTSDNDQDSATKIPTPAKPFSPTRKTMEAELVIFTDNMIHEELNDHGPKLRERIH